jgi:hypothetical protein
MFVNMVSLQHGKWKSEFNFVGGTWLVIMSIYVRITPLANPWKLFTISREIEAGGAGRVRDHRPI